MKLIEKFSLGRIGDLARFYFDQRVRGFKVPETPHFDPFSEEPFLSFLREAKLYLEFGSGGSTVTAAKYNIRTITVESDKYFANAVRRKIGHKNGNLIMSIDIGMTREWGFPIISRPSINRAKRWAKYIEMPINFIRETYPHFPDLVLVDGRFRVACALACAAEAIRMGSSTVICFDDYLDRDWYHVVEAHLGRPQMFGRMAVFTIDLGSVMPPKKAIDNAIFDPR